MMNKNHRSFLAALGAAVFLGGCDLLEVDNPNALVQADIEKVEAASAAVNGAQALAASGSGGIYAAFSTVGDEITWIGSRDAWNELNQGNAQQLRKRVRGRIVPRHCAGPLDDQLRGWAS